MLKSRRIGVVMGGLSSEREISLKSGQAVCSALNEAGLNVVPLVVEEESKQEIERLTKSNNIDLVFVAMHGHFGEDGKLQTILEELCLPYIGSRPLASQLAMDKIASRQVFQKANLTIPRFWIIDFDQDVDSLKSILKTAKYPLVVKPSSQGSSIGISFVDSFEGINEALDCARQFSQRVLVEEFIKGREITVSLLNGEALPIIEIVPKRRFFDYTAKYQKGMTEYLLAKSLTAEVERCAKESGERAYRVLGCSHLARADMIVSEEGKVYILEVNTIPGMTQMSLFPMAAKAFGLDFSQLCQRLLMLALQDEGILRKETFSWPKRLKISPRFSAPASGVNFMETDEGN